MELSEQALKRIQTIVAAEVTNRVSSAISELDIESKIKSGNDEKYNELLLKISELRSDHSALKRQYLERTEFLLRTINVVKQQLVDAEKERDELRDELDDLEQYVVAKVLGLKTYLSQLETNENLRLIC